MRYHKTALLFLTPFLTVFVAFYLAPVFYAIYLSLFIRKRIGVGPPKEVFGGIRFGEGADFLGWSDQEGYVSTLSDFTAEFYSALGAERITPRNGRFSVTGHPPVFDRKHRYLDLDWLQHDHAICGPAEHTQRYF